MSKNIIVFGGDGFCGWPTSLALSKVGYNITIVDNLSRRSIDQNMRCESLTPISDIDTRIRVWKEITGNEIKFVNIDVANRYSAIYNLLLELKPETVIHFAEQRSAPYSMKSPAHKMYTVTNNLNATHNILCAIVASGIDTHMIHLGSTGVYGYGTPGMKIPEGYLKVKVETDYGEKELEILYPPNPGSIYHMTKTQDALFFLYYNKNDGVRITDLHQGIVWGTNTIETNMDVRLINRFDYDGEYGTVLNRFLMQAAIGHPLTVYGSGGQTRAFININDTVNCIKIAIENPPKHGERVKIFNQTTECHNIKNLAKIISSMTGAKIKYYSNPRNEANRNDLEFCKDFFLNLGLNPITLQKRLLEEIIEVAKKYKGRCDRSKIICQSTWRSDILVDFEGSDSENIIN